MNERFEYPANFEARRITRDIVDDIETRAQYATFIYELRGTVDLSDTSDQLLHALVIAVDTLKLNYQQLLAANSRTSPLLQELYQLIDLENEDAPSPTKNQVIELIDEQIKKLI